MKYNNSQEEGFSLIEIVIGIALLLIIALSVMPLFTESTKNMHKSKTRSQGLRLARMKIEEIKEEVDDKKNDEDVDFDDYWSNNLEGDTTENSFSSDLNIQGDFERRVIIDEFNGISNIKEIKVIVSWEDKSLELKTLITKR